MRSAIVVAIAGSLLSAAFSLLSARGQATPAILDLLDRYAAGGFDATVAGFANIEDLGGARQDLREHGLAWVESAGLAEVPGRRLVAASFALELARARIDDAWPEGREIIVWGCELLRMGQPAPAERLWHLASIALAEGRRDWHLLWSRDHPHPGNRAARRDHLRHGLERFPDDVHLRFSPVRVDAIMQTANWPRGNPRAIAPFLYQSFSALERLPEFFDDPEVGHEAHLRAGLVLALGPRQIPPAMSHLEAASRASDPFVAYLAHYAAGRIQEHAGEWRAAEMQYRAALEAQPRTQSASLSLAALLFTSGRPDEAYEIARRAFDPPQPEDPFRLYGFGEYRHIDRYIADLRGELRR